MTEDYVYLSTEVENGVGTYCRDGHTVHLCVENATPPLRVVLNGSARSAVEAAAQTECALHRRTFQALIREFLDALDNDGEAVRIGVQSHERLTGRWRLTSTSLRLARGRFRVQVEATLPHLNTSDAQVARALLEGILDCRERALEALFHNMYQQILDDLHHN